MPEKLNSLDNVEDLLYKHKDDPGYHQETDEILARVCPSTCLDVTLEKVKGADDLGPKNKLSLVYNSLDKVLNFLTESFSDNFQPLCVHIMKLKTVLIDEMQLKMGVRQWKINNFFRLTDQPPRSRQSSFTSVDICPIDLA